MGSAASTMNAGPGPGSASASTDAATSSSVDASNASSPQSPSHAGGTPEPESACGSHDSPPKASASTTASASTSMSSSSASTHKNENAAKPDVASLRAAALKSARAKKVADHNRDSQAGPSARSAADIKGKGRAQPDDEKEDGEISDDAEAAEGTFVSQTAPTNTTGVTAASAASAASGASGSTVPPAPPRTPSIVLPPSALTIPNRPGTPLSPLASGILRSTIVTISGDKGTVRAELPSPIHPGDEESQWVELIRTLVHDGVLPQTLIEKGVPPQYVSRVCKDLLQHQSPIPSLRHAQGPSQVSSSSQRPQTPRATPQQRTLWSEFREAHIDESTAPSVAGEEAPSRARSKSLSRSRSRSTSPEITVAIAMGRTSSESSAEALVDRMSPPPDLVIAPGLAPRIVSSWTPVSASGPSAVRSPAPAPARAPPAPPVVPGAVHLDSYRPASRPASADPHREPKGKRRRRDLDRAREAQVETLNYEESPASPTPVVTVSAPDTLAVPTPSLPSVLSIAETRRRALESLRRKKPASASTPMAATLPALAVPSASSAAADHVVENLERQVASTEEPMDIDDEMEDGEIEDEPAPAPAPAPVLPTPSRASSSQSVRGIKRPRAEDLDSRPTSASARLLPKRRTFGGAGRRHHIAIILDDLSDSDSEDEEPSPPIHVPVIVIPPPIEARALLAEKEENIRRLKEQIAARLSAQKAGTTASGSGTPSVAARIEAAEQAADQVGVEGVAAEVVEAAVMAAVDEQGKHKHEHKHTDAEAGAEADDGDVQMEANDSDAVHAGVASPPAQEAAPSSAFRPYVPLLARYPRLKPPLTSLTHSRSIESEPEPDRSATTPALALTIDWPLVSNIILTHRLQDGGTPFWCRSEAGAGQCADPACPDLHFGALDPSDEDIVLYVQNILALDSDNSKSQDKSSNEENENENDQQDTTGFNTTEIAAALTAARKELDDARKAKAKAKTPKGKSKKSKGSKNGMAAGNSNSSKDDGDNSPEDGLEQRLTALIAMTAQRLQAR